MSIVTPHTPTLRLLALVGSALLMLLVTVNAQAQAFAQETSVNVSFATPPKEPVPVYVLAGQSCLVIFDEPIGRLAVSNIETAEAVLVAPNQMMVNGKISGRARFTAWSKDTTQFVFFDVDVRVNLAQIDSQVRALFPGMDVRLSQANGAVVVSGNVPSTVLKQVEEIVKAAGYKTVNLTSAKIEDALQVQLTVKVAEVQRNKTSEFAYSPAVGRNGAYGATSVPGSPYTTDGSLGLGDPTQSDPRNRIIPTALSSATALNVFFMAGNVFNYLKALQTSGALRALAEPNLVALNGKTASFLAGGEIPVPIVQAGGGGGGAAVTIVWKEYGVRLNFTPTILDETHIRLELEPEVSTLDYASAVTFQGFRIPGLRVRRAKTSIELSDGQTFGIAGLLDNNESKSMGKIPVLADVPIIGNLFKSRSFQRNETEMVFIVTPKLVKAWNADQVPNFREVENLRNGSPLGVSFPDNDKSGRDKDDKDGETKADEKKADELNEKKEGEESKPAAEDKSGEAAAEPAKPEAEEAKPSTEAPSTPAQPVAAPAGEANGEDKSKTIPTVPSVNPPATGNDSPASPTSSDKVPATKTATKRSSAPQRDAKPVTALQWKLNVPVTATVTAQNRQQ